MTTLCTARLVLRRLAPADVEPILAMDSDPRVMRHIRAVPTDLAAHRRLIEARIARSAQDAPLGFWAVTEAGRFLGWCGLFELDGGPEIEIGYRYRADAWGRGIATEAGRAVRDHGFATAGLDTIVAVTHPDNRASQNVLQKLGLVLLGGARHYGTDVLKYSITRGRWLRRKEAA